jgi:predicted secreted protein
MNDMRFFVAPETLKAAQDELTTAALKMLKDRTTHVAGDLGLKIERYKSISIGNASEELGDASRKVGKAVATVAGKRAPPAVAAGYALVTLQVSAVAIMMQ